jgi:plasmid maintenance system antidote protein VapI
METNNTMHPGYILRQLLKAHDLKAKDLASTIGVSAALLSNVTTGQKPVNIELAHKLEKWLSELMRGEMTDDLKALGWLTAQAAYDVEDYARKRSMEAAAESDQFEMVPSTRAYEARMKAEVIEMAKAA